MGSMQEKIAVFQKLEKKDEDSVAFEMLVPTPVYCDKPVAEESSKDLLVDSRATLVVSSFIITSVDGQAFLPLFLSLIEGGSPVPSAVLTPIDSTARMTALTLLSPSSLPDVLGSKEPPTDISFTSVIWGVERVPMAAVVGGCVTEDGALDGDAIALVKSTLMNLVF